MTDLEKLLELLASFDVRPEVVRPGDPVPEGVTADPNHVAVRLNAKEGGVLGYARFCCDFTFTPEGRFEAVGVWE